MCIRDSSSTYNNCYCETSATAEGTCDIVELENSDLYKYGIHNDYKYTLKFIKFLGRRVLIFIVSLKYFSLSVTTVPKCKDNPIWGPKNTKIPQKFASEWCGNGNGKNYWECGLSLLIGEDTRNLANVDYQCDCSGTKNCPEAGNVIVF